MTGITLLPSHLLHGMSYIPPKYSSAKSGWKGEDFLYVTVIKRNVEFHGSLIE
jgi:hypothetical protein